MSPTRVLGRINRRRLLGCAAAGSATLAMSNRLVPALAASQGEKKPVVITATEGKKLNVMGHSATIKLGQRQTAGDYYVFEIVSPPGAGIPPHVHRNEDEIIHVRAGRYELMLGGRRYEASGGDTIHFPRNVPHAFRNVGSTPSTTLWTVIPGSGFEKFFEELAALPPGAPDLAKVAAIFARYQIELLSPNPK